MKSGTPVGKNSNYIKGTVSVISSDASIKEGITRFTKVPIKPLTDQGWKTYLLKEY